ncbi:MAG: hypothetical protein WDN46_05215 [Methylocella sp.]
MSETSNGLSQSFAEIRADLAVIRSDMAIVKWMAVLNLFGVLLLVIKSFWPAH